MKKAIIDDRGERQKGNEAMNQAVREYQTKSELPFPGGFLRPKASARDFFPPDKATWLKRRVAKLLGEE